MDTIQLSPGPATYSGPGSAHRHGRTGDAVTRRSVWSVIVTGPRRGIETLLLWQERFRMRRKLLELDGRMLDDVGLSRAEIWREAQKPFWRE